MSDITDRRIGDVFAVYVEIEDGVGGVSPGTIGDLFRRAAQVINTAGAEGAVFLDCGYESDDTTASLHLFFEQAT